MFINLQQDEDENNKKKKNCLKLTKSLKQIDYR